MLKKPKESLPVDRLQQGLGPETEVIVDAPPPEGMGRTGIVDSFQQAPVRGCGLFGFFVWSPWVVDGRQFQIMSLRHIKKRNTLSMTLHFALSETNTAPEHMQF